MTTTEEEVEMKELVGLVRILVKRGINLARRDALSSDPYVVITMGSQVFFSFSSSVSNLIWFSAFL